MQSKKRTQRNEGEGNKTAARRYNAAAKGFTNSYDTALVARKASHELTQLLDQLRHFEVGMLVTERKTGRLAARPMYVADQGEDGSVRLITQRDANLVSEIKREKAVVVTFQDGHRYLSLSARAELLEDPNALPKLWKEGFRLWFPEGPTSSRAAVLRLLPEEAEFWDESGFEAARYWARAAISYLKGESMQQEPVGKHGSVSFVAPSRD